jgi:hypothetical protein
VKSHLVWYSFAKDYTIRKFHGEAKDSSEGASDRRGNSSNMHECMFVIYLLLHLYFY